MIVMVVISATSILQYHFDFVKSYLETARNNTMQPVIFSSEFIQYASNPNDIFIKSINQSINQSITLLKQKDPKALHIRHRTSVLETIRKPPLVEAENAVVKPKKYGQKRFSRWRPFAILNFWGLIMGSVKSPCRNARNRIRAH